MLVQDYRLIVKNLLYSLRKINQLIRMILTIIKNFVIKLKIITTTIMEGKSIITTINIINNLKKTLLNQALII